LNIEIMTNKDAGHPVGQKNRNRRLIIANMGLIAGAYFSQLDKIL